MGKLSKKSFIIILVMMSLALTGFSSGALAEETTFKDVKEYTSFYEEIMFLHGEEIIFGYEDDTFRPTDGVTRAAASAMIGRALGLDGTKRDSSFEDVPEQSFASGYIASAVEEGVINGYNDGTFRPNQLVTRGEMAIFISRAFELTSDTEAVFQDTTPSMASFEAIQAVYGNGIAKGFSDYRFYPYKTITRGEFSAFLARGGTVSFQQPVEDVKAVEVKLDVDKDFNLTLTSHKNGEVIHANPLQPIKIVTSTESDKPSFKYPGGVLTEFEYGSYYAPRALGVGEITAGLVGDPVTIPVTYIPKTAENQKPINGYVAELASHKIMTSCPMSLNGSTAQDVMDYYGTEPDSEGYLGGGYGRTYGQCTYYSESDTDLTKKIVTIDFTNEDDSVTAPAFKKIVGTPDWEGISELDGYWTQLYRLDGMELYASYFDKGAPLHTLRLKHQ
ncbi:S-layer homology domain-containing protein [Rossellomorea sp. YZS02]|uniref:S-layer homology domain-containing protein n=1 Tax=Rossellomorea sp. YZS02 TaxID=3097358 RepID=UPI002A1346FE|nr:S-layer homology domain-containing protein [Rossellomorea sp. YZS02]MDX8344138.1 S-layer homology domain-containing protein [Rossellomorea sp. YZS02]